MPNASKKRSQYQWLKWQASGSVRSTNPNPSHDAMMAVMARRHFATSRTYVHSVEYGDDITFTARRMDGIANQKWATVKAEHCSIDLVAVPGTGKDAIVAFFMGKVQERYDTYLKSPQAQQDEKDEQERTQRLQTVLDDAVMRLEVFDFTSLADIIGWFEKVQPSMDYIYITPPGEKIVAKFKEHGFESNVNLGEAFNGEDEENVARHIIGQALGLIEVNNHLHQVLFGATEKWRERFGHNAT